MASSVVQGATGDPFIDGLLRGTKWNGNFTYSFPQSAGDYQLGNEETATFSPVTFQQREATRAIMSGFTFSSATTNVMKATNVDSFIGVSVTQTASDGFNGLGDIRLGKSPLANPTAYGYYPSNAVNGEGGDVWFGDNYAGTVNDYRNPFLGGYAYHTHIHELGHAMGLKHAHETGGVAGVAVPASRDSIEFTVMSYRSYVGGPDSGGYTYGTNDGPQTFMQYDILALQTMYGAEYGASSNNTNTNYTWSATTGEMFINGAAQGTPGGNRVFLTIWDGGGIDTYDMSNYATGVTINLNPGGWSITSNAQRADLGAGHQANGNVYNSFLFGGNLASIIENAVGGAGSDSITGNQVANTLKGGGGDDTLAGADGNDFLLGENGNDALKGGGGADTLWGLENNDTLKGGGGADALLGGNGFDMANYADAGGGISVDLAAGTGAGDVAAGDTLSGIEGINGSIHNDILHGDGNANELRGDDGFDTLNGRAGVDTILGGDDNDTFVVNTGDHGAGEQYNGGNGSDRLMVELNIAFTAVALTSFEEVEFSVGIAAPKTANFLAAQIGAGLSATATIDGALIGQQDILRVSFGAATSVDLSGLTFIDWNPSAPENDQVLVIGSAAADTIIGSDVNDIIHGNASNDNAGGGTGDDSLTGGAGNDTLNGGAGFDTLVGGDGDDTYVSTDANDTLIEALGAGSDTLRSAVSVAVLAANVEDLVLIGAAVIDGTGNGLDNEIIGNGQVNVLLGANGSDSMMGGNGNDTMNGGANDDRLGGSGDDDRINGGAGNDTLAGGANADSFVFSSALSALTNVDRVLDFTAADLVLLENTVFTGIGALLDAAEFRIGAAAADASDRIIYNSATGNMFFDADGNGGTAQIRFAALASGLALTNADFLMV